MTDKQPPRPAAPTVLAKTSGGCALLFNYQKGEGLPPHTHVGQTVIVAVLHGQLQLNIDEQAQILMAGEVFTSQTTGLFSSLALTDETRILITLLEC